MTISAQLRELKRLTDHLASGTPVIHGAIPWASPILMFGNLARSRIATLGLNPSNLEFVAQSGAQLEGDQRRFHSLTSLGLTRWQDAKPDDIKRIWKYCDAYFQRNPYDRWFKRLNILLSQVGVSYYDEFQPACHLDLVPYATALKWSALTKVQQQQLGIMGAASLLQLLRASNIKILILNGMSVVREFSRLLDVPLIPQEIPAWALPNSRGGVKGYAYELRLTEIQGKALGREILVLGYNHNIQSSFGVTNKVIAEISAWISKSANGVTL